MNTEAKDEPVDSPIDDQADDAHESASASESAADNDTPTNNSPSDEELLAALKQAQAKAEDNWSKFVEAKAEADNVRKRSEKDVSNARLFALEKFVNELLPIKDSLEMGIKAAGESAEAENLRQGTELTLKMFQQVFNKFGVDEINQVGEKMNPDLHEAVSMVPNPDAEPNTVVEIIQKGYTLNKRLVRPAMVIVAK